MRHVHSRRTNAHRRIHNNAVKNKLLPFKKYAEEMTVNGQRIVSYNNDQPPDWTAIIVVCSILFLLGTGFLFAYRATILHNRKQQQKRDARIIKKYGALKK